MKGIILVGGEGTRLRPLTAKVPKPMVPIVNRPFLRHMIDHLRGHGIKDIILAMAYLPDKIQGYFGDGRELNVELIYVVEQVPLGTAGAVKNILDQIGLDETFFVFNGDVFTDLNLTAMLQWHREKRALVSIGLTPVEDPTAYGIVELEADERVRRFIEKPAWDAVTTNLINAGTYIVEPAAFKYVPPKIHFMFENGLFPVLLQVGEPVYGYASNAYWIDIGTPQRYQTVHHDLLMGRVALDFPGQRAHDGLWVGRDCRVDPSAHITGPVVLGDGCTIGPGARLTGPTVLGEGCSVGRDSSVEDSVIWARTQIRRQVHVRGCVVAESAVIEDSVWLSGGAIIGDGVTIGSGNRLEKGIKVSAGVALQPNAITF
ncbi:MAG: NDP-sugar synthase [Chloroflexi bacterium]|nr:NDP-sugar synthase [Chloroflexota bacterium]